MARLVGEDWNDASQSISPDGRCLGSLRAITDSERNALRSIGSTAQEAALRTSKLLAGLRGTRSVLIFQGVLPAGTDLPRIPHVLGAGRRVVLIESVTWPPGAYGTSEEGRIHCDGVYIGQSVGPLLAAVSYWRELLPPDHRVSAVVIVHRITDGELTLPAATSAGLTWVSASETAPVTWRYLTADRRAVSAGTRAALISATDGASAPESDR
jgi:hypothetical protein